MPVRGRSGRGVRAPIETASQLPPQSPTACACHPPQHASEKDTAARPDAQEAAEEAALPSATSCLAGADAPAQAAGLAAAATACSQQPFDTQQQQQDVQQDQQDGDGWRADVVLFGAALSPPPPEDSGLQKKKRTRWLEFPPASLQFAMLLSENSVKLKSFHVPGGCSALVGSVAGPAEAVHAS